MIVLERPEDLEIHAKKNPILIVLFGSKNCSACGAIQGKIDYWRSTNGKAQFLYIPTDKFQATCAQLGVFSAPTLWVYVEGKLSIRESGLFGVHELLGRIDRYYEILERKKST